MLKEACDYQDENGQPKGRGWRFGCNWEKPLPPDVLKTSRSLTRLSYLTYGLYENKEAKEIIPLYHCNNDIANSLLKTGIINTGKMPAYSNTSPGHQYSIVQDWLDIDIRQLREYDPDIIVFGGTFDLYSKSLGLSDFVHDVKEDEFYVNMRLRIINCISVLAIQMQEFLRIPT